MHKFLILVLLTLLPISSARADEDRIILEDATRQKCLEVLRAGMRSEEFWPSIHAAEGLTIGGQGDEVIEYLTPKLSTETDDQQRCGIIRELVRAGDRSRADLLLQILDKDDDHGHIHAAESLYKLNIIGDGKAIRRGFNQKQNMSLKLMSAAALARKGNAESLKFLRETLSHQNPTYFKTAAWVLGRIGDETDIVRLQMQLPRCPDNVTKAFLQHSLAALGDPGGLKALASNLHHDEAAVRTYAAVFAGEARAINTAAALEKLLDDQNPDTRYRAAQSLLTLAAAPEKTDTHD
jgi:sialidase-1